MQESQQSQGRELLGAVAKNPADRRTFKIQPAVPADHHDHVVAVFGQRREAPFAAPQLAFKLDLMCRIAHIDNNGFDAGHGQRVDHHRRYPLPGARGIPAAAQCLFKACRAVGDRAARQSLTDHRQIFNMDQLEDVARLVAAAPDA